MLFYTQQQENKLGDISDEKAVSLGAALGLTTVYTAQKVGAAAYNYYFGNHQQAAFPLAAVLVSQSGHNAATHVGDHSSIADSVAAIDGDAEVPAGLATVAETAFVGGRASPTPPNSIFDGIEGEVGAVVAPPAHGVAPATTFTNTGVEPAIATAVEYSM